MFSNVYKPMELVDCTFYVADIFINFACYYISSV